MQKDIEGPKAIGEEGRQVAGKENPIVWKEGQQPLRHLLLLGGIGTFDKDHRTLLFGAEDLLEGLQGDLDARAALRAIDADDRQGATEGDDPAPRTDAVVEGIFLVDDRDISRVGERFSINDTHPRGLGKGGKVDAIDLLQPQSVASSHLEVLADGRGDCHAGHLTNRLEVAQGEGQIGGGHREPLTARPEHQLDPNIGIPIRALLEGSPDQPNGHDDEDHPHGNPEDADERPCRVVAQIR